MSNYMRFVVFLVFAVEFIFCLSPTKTIANSQSMLEESVYRIVVARKTAKGYAASTGTGFLVGGQRYVATNHHVIDMAIRHRGAIFIAHKGVEGEAGTIAANIIWSSERLDLAILKSEKDLPGHPLLLAEIAKENPEKLSKVIAIGYPGGADHAVLKGATNFNSIAAIMNGVEGYLDATMTPGFVQRVVLQTAGNKDRYVIQHGAAINKGNSGGPLFDACNRIIGVNTFKPGRGADASGIFYAVHVSELISNLRRQKISINSSSYTCAGTGNSAGLTLINLVTIAAALTSLLLASLVYYRKPVAKAASRVFSRHHIPVPHPNPNAGPPALGHQGHAGKTNLVLKSQNDATEIVLDNSLKKLTGTGLVLGSASGMSDIVINNDSVSRAHARLTYSSGGGLQITDLLATNTTKLNGKKLTPNKATPLRQNDQIQMGEVSYLVKGTVVPPAAYDQTVKQDKSNDSWRLSGFDSQGGLLQHHLEIPASLPQGERLVDICTMGSDNSQCSFLINDDTVSRCHAKICYVIGESLGIRDLNSTNGTYVDGHKIGTDYVYLKNGSNIRLGEISLSLSKTSGGSWLLN